MAATLSMGLSMGLVAGPSTGRSPAFKHGPRDYEHDPRTLYDMFLTSVDGLTVRA
jgi:hypothetical protein